MTNRLKQAALVVLGLYVCLAATIVHRQIALIGDIELPWGLLLGLLAAYAVARAVDPWARLGAVFFALGWSLALMLPMLAPGDSYLVAEDWLGLTFMFASLAALALAVIRAVNAD